MNWSRDLFTYKIPPRTTPNGFSSAAKPMVASWKDKYRSMKQMEQSW